MPRPAVLWGLTGLGLFPQDSPLDEQCHHLISSPPDGPEGI
ncbi:MAG TPA: hypothetical protein PKZ24_08330 [Nitrospirales bacterium]|nr:hypothetical protein [Nitrospirales bacterium]